MSRQQSGYLLAEWLLAGLLGVLVLSTIVMSLQVQLRLAASQRLPLQTATAAHWLFQRLELALLKAGEGGVHPFALDNPAAGIWPDDQLVLQRLVLSHELDCEGRKAEAGVLLLERYFLRNDSASADKVLACDAGHCQQGQCQFWGDAGVAIQPAVFALVFAYGQHDHGSEVLAYISKSALQVEQRVTAIKLGLALISQDKQMRALPWAWPASWLQPQSALAADQRIRRAWVQTIEVPHG